ncbi:unnamed protein product [Cylindrotheca closterium]|uniref:Uncharacterized protein n=1 Tax=Cylindrotheca closterium TaxID=2856 RepID=A0AAD2GCN5_9STRA|nr:unnamed protein product [Cylindrotheca closterium]
MSSYLRNDRLQEQQSQLEYKAIMMNADFKDYRFYSRIVIGIGKTLETTENAKLRDQNQALIDHIHSIRHTHVSARASPEPDDVSSRILDEDDFFIFEMED